MEGMRYSRQNYNELKRRQYGGYTRNQNDYFLYMKNYYEEYIRKQNKQYLDMKQYYEEYIKNQNKQYLSMMKYYEELMQKQDDNYKNLKIDYEEKLNYYTDFIDNKRNTYLSDSYQEESKNSYNEVNIDDNNKTTKSKDKPYELLETTQEDCNLEYKDNSVGEYNNLENTYYNEEKDSINKEVLKVEEKKHLEEDSKDIQDVDEENELDKCKEKDLKECEENFIEDNKEEVTKYTNDKPLKGNNEHYLEEGYKENCKEEKDRENFNNSEHKDYKEENQRNLLKKEEDNTENKERHRCSDNFNKEVLEIEGEKLLEDDDKVENEEIIRCNDNFNEEVLEIEDEKFSEEDDKAENKERIGYSDNFNKDVLAIRDEKFLEDNKDIYVKFPIILAETNIAVTIDDTMKIGRDVKEIRRIKMNAFFKSSNLVPISLKNSEVNSGMLFVSGFIRKSVEYATRTFIEERKEDNCGYIKYCIVEVPFNFTTKITFIRPPVLIENYEVRDDSSCDASKLYDTHEDSIILCENCNENFLSTEVFNEKPFVELVKANFIEFNIHKELPLKEDEEIQERYTKLKGNIIVNLRIRVLQEQDLRIEI